MRIHPITANHHGHGGINFLTILTTSFGFFSASNPNISVKQVVLMIVRMIVQWDLFVKLPCLWLPSLFRHVFQLNFCFCNT